VEKHDKIYLAGQRLRERGVRFYDLAQIFADTTAPLYVDDCCHLNRRGYSVIARTVAAAIGER
jgi:lysophospholipase L1-like esterase